ncbi:tRNA (N6-threonylcarbamoyladenosine(37)-N6)-methyltransferase TrmO [Chloroflexota bacterium]
MTSELPTMTVKAIGVVRNEVKEKPQNRGDWWTGLDSEIVIDPALTEALDGLDGFSHIIVLFWMHRLPEKEMPLKVHPMRKQELPLTGILATRAPNRPSRIGMTVVRLLHRQGNILGVRDFDALDGTPVIDIKPYIPIADLVDDTRVPPWINSR